MTVLLAVAIGIFWLLVAVVHSYWGLGGKWFADRVFPSAAGKPAQAPAKLACWAVVPVFAGFSFFTVALGLPGIVPDGDHRWLGALDYGGYVLAAVCVLRSVGDFKYVGFTKRVRGTAFAHWDTALYSPLCLAAGCATAALAILR